MLQKRVIVCLDVRDGKTTKGIKFKHNIDIGDPATMARHYYKEGADELVFYDITASIEKRSIMLEVVREVAEKIFIPFSVGGGIGTVDEMRAVLLAGAEKVSINTLAVKNPTLIEEGASRYGRQCIVLGMDVLKDTTLPSGYGVVIEGGRTPTGKDALEWACKAEKLGAGEIVLNSIDTDGTQDGYEIPLTKMISEAVMIPVVASGGAGTPQHLVDICTNGKADAVLIASMVHYGNYSIQTIKEHMERCGVSVRMDMFSD
jgi:cyclase